MNFDRPARVVLAVVLMYPIIASAFFVLWPEKVRAEKYYRKNPKMAKLSFSARWIESEHYARFLRLQGGVGLAIGIGLLVLLWKVG